MTERDESNYMKNLLKIFFFSRHFIDGFRKFMKDRSNMRTSGTDPYIGPAIRVYEQNEMTVIVDCKQRKRKRERKKE